MPVSFSTTKIQPTTKKARSYVYQLRKLKALTDGGRRAGAFFLHALYGRVPEAVKAADDSGISHKEISRALELRRERARGSIKIGKAKIGGGGWPRLGG